MRLGCRLSPEFPGFRVSHLRVLGLGLVVNPKNLETGLRTNSAGIPYILLFTIEAIGFPTFGLYCRVRGSYFWGVGFSGFLDGFFFLDWACNS